MDEHLRKLERDAAAGDLESAARLEAAERRSRILPRWNPLTRVRCQLAFACPKSWDEMPPAEREGVRHCDHCAKDVHEARTEAEFLEHAKAGRCVSVPAAAGFEVLVDGQTRSADPVALPYNGPVMGVAAERLTGEARPPALSLVRLLLAAALFAGAAYGLAGWLGWLPLPWG